MDKTKQLSNFFRNAPNSISLKTQKTSQEFKVSLLIQEKIVAQQKINTEDKVQETQKITTDDKNERRKSILDEIMNKPQQNTDNLARSLTNFQDSNLQNQDTKAKSQENFFQEKEVIQKVQENQDSNQDEIVEKEKPIQEELILIKESSSRSVGLNKQKTRKENIEKQIEQEAETQNQAELKEKIKILNESIPTKTKTEGKGFSKGPEKGKIMNRNTRLQDSLNKNNSNNSQANTTYNKTRTKLSPLMHSKYEIEHKIKFDRLKEMEQKRFVLIQKLMGIDEEIENIKKDILPQENIHENRVPKFTERHREISKDKSAQKEAIALVRKLHVEKKERELKKIEKINQLSEKLKMKSDFTMKEIEERKKTEMLQKQMKVYDWYENRKKQIDEQKKKEAKSKEFVMNIYQGQYHNKSRLGANKKEELEEILKEKIDEYEKLKEKERELEKIEKGIV